MKLHHFLSIFIIALLGGCATASKTDDLHQGMTQAQVKEQIGDPSHTQFINNKLIWKYTLLRPFVGMQPYYLIFNPSTQRLESWYMDEAEFQANQQQWLNAAQNFSAQQEQQRQQQQAAYQQNLENQQRQQIINQQQQQLNQQRYPPMTTQPPQESPKTHPLSDPECGICGAPMMGTGRSQTNPNTYKLMQEHRCLKGHTAWVIVQ